MVLTSGGGICGGSAEGFSDLERRRRCVGSGRGGRHVLRCVGCILQIVALGARHDDVIAASGVMPPACASTSIKVTWRSAS